MNDTVGDSQGGPHRRPRVREVRSRFMSPSPVGPPEFQTKQQQQQQRSKIMDHQQQHHETSISRRSYSSDSSPLGSSHNYNKLAPTSNHHRAAVKLLFKENNAEAAGGGGGAKSDDDDSTTEENDVILQQQPKRTSGSISIAKSSSSRRPDTPTVPPSSSSTATSTADRMIPSRFRQLNFHQTPHHTNKFSAAAKLLQSSGLSDMRSSMPADTRLTSSNTANNNNNSDLKMISAASSPCSRSLNLLLSSSAKMMAMGDSGLSLPPPHPPSTKLIGDPAAALSRKGRKVSAYHSLGLLQNYYLQWRFANAKAEASLRAQTTDAERKIFSLGVKISDLREVVERKRIELGLLQRTQTLSTIIETHMPYLSEWSALEEDYSTSLSGITHALVNSLVRLPVSGNVQADIKEVEETLNSAIKVMELIGIHIQRFMPKANEMDTMITELARLVGGERVVIEECGDLLLKTYTSQVEDLSLRGHLMQLKNNNHFRLEE